MQLRAHVQVPLVCQRCLQPFTVPLTIVPGNLDDEALVYPAYERFLHDTLFKLPGITHVRSSIVLDTIKRSVQVPLGDSP